MSKPQNVAELPRLFISFATADAALANAFANFVQLGGDLTADQVFVTARPSTIPKGTPFVDAIREGLEGSALAVMLLTPSYYESRFCLAELGALWVRQQNRFPIVVPPVDYADLDGVQLGEQAVRITSAEGLDELRDAIAASLGTQVPTALWNQHKADFLNKWDVELADAIATPQHVPVALWSQAQEQLELQERELADLREDAARLKRYAKELGVQNAELRARVGDAPAPPELEGNEDAQLIAVAEAAIERAASLMDKLPMIVREALYQMHHDGRALTVGGWEDPFRDDQAQEEVELGRLKWVEDAQQVVQPRTDHPVVGEADEALGRVREAAFDGGFLNARGEAGDWIKPYLKERYGIDDPVFELRPVWEALDFL